MRRLVGALPFLASALAAVACAFPGGDGGAIETGVAATLTSVAAAAPTEPPTPAPTPTAAPLPARLWKSYSSGGDTGWWLENGTAIEVTLPVEPGQYYDYNSVNGKILYASHFATSGAGPGNLAVSDLWMVDYPSGTPLALIPNDTVVEALWAPDGSGFLYIGATPTTYELRYRSLAGEDRLLASSVAPTWGVSPSGSQVAFTRETGYEVPGAPGLFVVSTAGGPETMVSSAERHGTGSIEDRPTWSADETRLALPNYGYAPGTLVIAAADGSLDTTLGFTPELAADPVLGSYPQTVLWHPDGQQLVGVSNYAEGMGGPWALVLYQLDDDGHTVVSGARLGTGLSIIDWNVSGQSLFALDENGQVVLVSLP